MNFSTLFVYAVVASNHFRRSEIMAVRLSVDEAKQLAEKLEPNAKFAWRDFSDGAFIEGNFPGGPRYSYSIESVRVTVP